jgi:hypothetical protein
MPVSPAGALFRAYPIETATTLRSLLIGRTLRVNPEYSEASF